MGLLALLGSFFKSLAIALGWAHDESLKQTGIDLQQGRDAKDALVTEKKVADVAAQPVTPSDVDSALSEGKF